MSRIHAPLLFAVIVALSVPSLATAAPEGKPDAAARKEAMLKKFDKDGDGKLNDEEKAAMKAEWQKRRGEGGKGPDAARRAEMMKKFDKDGDGKLSEEERAAMRAEMQKKRGEGGKAAGKGKAEGKAKPKKKAE